MKITATVTVDIPSEVFKPGHCRRFNAPLGEIECCQFIEFMAMKCLLFNEPIPGGKKCRSCVTAHREAESGDDE